MSDQVLNINACLVPFNCIFRVEQIILVMHNQKLALESDLRQLLLQVYGILISLKFAFCVNKLGVLVNRVLHIRAFVKALKYVVASFENHVDKTTHNLRAVHRHVLRT